MNAVGEPFSLSIEGRRITSLAFLFLGLVICVQQAKAQDPGVSRAGDASCGPPNYCARTDRRVQPYSKTPPAVGPAGSIINDPAFSSRILRVTDEKSDPKAPGRSLMSPASAAQNPWNSASTRFYVMNTAGAFLLFDFNPASLAIHMAGAPRLDWRGEPQFSFTQANILYGVGDRSADIEQYDISTGKASTLNDPSKCIKLESSDKAFALSASADDNRFTTVIGPQQDRNYLVYIYDRGKGCRWYNTQTGEVGGQWGPKGKVSIDDRYGVHNAHLSKSGRFVMIGRGAGPAGGGKWRIWDLETLKVTVCPSQCGGHQAVGYAHILNPGGNHHPLAMLKRPWDRLDSVTPVVSDLGSTAGYWYDSHVSWSNADADDSNPACLSTYRPTNPSTPATPLDVNGPWENEIICLETDGKGSKIWRFAHTYSTAKNGFWSQPRGNVSPDGRFFLFTSDWQDQLGKAPDGKYRTDAFVVELH